MSWKDYFEKAEGMGILSTADGDGHVDSAVYARPHVMDEETLAFIMRPRRSYTNLQSNPKAVYLFAERAPGYRGKRIYLEKVREMSDPQEVDQARRGAHGHGVNADEAYLVVFRITEARPLVGDFETD